MVKQLGYKGHTSVLVDVYKDRPYSHTATLCTEASPASCNTELKSTLQITDTAFVLYLESVLYWGVL